MLQPILFTIGLLSLNMDRRNSYRPLQVRGRLAKMEKRSFSILGMMSVFIQLNTLRRRETLMLMMCYFHLIAS